MWLVVAVAVLRCQDGTCALVPEVEDYPFCSTIDRASARAAARVDVEVQELRVAANGRELEVLLAAKWMRGVERLSACTDERGVRALARSRRLRALRELTLASSGGAAFDAATVRALVRSPTLRSRLRSLRFEAGDSEAQQSIDTAGVRELARARRWKLQTLDLSWNYVIGDAIPALVGSSLARTLEHLLLCETAFRASHVDDLVAARLSRLTLLCVPDAPLLDADVARLRSTYGDAVVLAPDEAETRLDALRAR